MVTLEEFPFKRESRRPQNWELLSYHYWFFSTWSSVDLIWNCQRCKLTANKHTVPRGKFQYMWLIQLQQIVVCPKHGYEKLSVRLSFQKVISLLWKISLLAGDVKLNLPTSSKKRIRLNYKANKCERIDYKITKSKLLVSFGEFQRRINFLWIKFYDTSATFRQWNL